MSDRSSLARRPAHLATSEDVQMKMVDGLSALRAVVDHHSVAVLQLQGLRDVLCCEKELTENSFVLKLQLLTTPVYFKDNHPAAWRSE